MVLTDGQRESKIYPDVPCSQIDSEPMEIPDAPVLQRELTGCVYPNQLLPACQEEDLEETILEDLNDLLAPGNEYDTAYLDAENIIRDNFCTNSSDISYDNIIEGKRRSRQPARLTPDELPLDDYTDSDCSIGSETSA